METKEEKLINSMLPDNESSKILSEFLGYSLGKDPIDPTSDIRVMFTNKTNDKSVGVIAIEPIRELDDSTDTVNIRKLYERVLEINKEFGINFRVSAIGFIGTKRLVFFPTIGGNRDTRLDLTPQTIGIDLYKRNLAYLKMTILRCRKVRLDLVHKLILTITPLEKNYQVTSCQ